jgi:hypothetical protein
MAGDSGYVDAVNKIRLAGPFQSREKYVETATDMYPGRLVKRGTTDNDVVVNTDGSAVSYGFLGYEDTAIPFRPATVDTIYATDDRAKVLFGPGMIVVGSLAASQTIIMGDKLVAAAAGRVKKWTPTLVESVQVDIVAKAVKSVSTGVGVYADIVLESLI